MAGKIVAKFPFRKEFIKEHNTRRFYRSIEVPFDYQLGAVLIIDGYEYPIYNIWSTNIQNYSWTTFRNFKPVFFTEEQVLNSTVFYTKLKDA